jgi:dCTP diphosphatase
MVDRDSLMNVMNIIDEFTRERDWEQFHSVKNIMTSILIESAELSETIQWTNPTKDEVLLDLELTENIEDEVADVMVYCLRLCSILDIDPIQAMGQKIVKNRVKYPINKSKGNSAKYTSYEN